MFFFIFVKLFEKYYTKFFVAFSPLNIRPWIPGSVSRPAFVFKTLDPDPQEMDADPKPCF